MRVNVFLNTTIVLAAFCFGVIPANSDQTKLNTEGGASGYLEVECNISNVVIYLCPKAKFRRQTVRRFFGLVKYHKNKCAGDPLYLGTTPFKPLPFPAGSYVVLIPPQYAGEQEDPVEVLVEPGKKSFLMLKLLNIDGYQQSPDSEDHPGSGSAGAVGTGPTP
jgi:hypothetical protein